jgi:hypothetical protein
MLKLSPKAIHEDMVVRSPSQVGYVAKVKKSRGMKLTRPPPWDPEAGYPELREELGHLEKRLAKLNKSKRTTEDIPDDSWAARLMSMLFCCSLNFKGKLVVYDLLRRI